MNASASAATATATSTAALTAYLKPLLKKHDLGQLLILDDLMQAWDDAVIHCGGNASIQKQLQTLHESQLNEYTLSAQQSLTEYAQTVELPGMEDTDTEQLYIDHCLAALQIPDWKLPDAPSRVLNIVRERAITAWQKQGNEMEGIGNEGIDNTMEDEEGAVTTTTTTTAMTTKPHKKNLLGVNKKVTPKKKVMVTKQVIGATIVPATIVAAATTTTATTTATTTTKSANRGGGRKMGGSRGRRGGRGGTAGKA